MGSRLRIRQHALDEVIAHAREASPDECCGLLIGTTETVEVAFRARNLRPGPAEYLVDPADHFAAIRMAREKKLDVIGAYHSHPSSQPLPSKRDRSEASPGFVYLIVAPGGPNAAAAVRAFVLGPERMNQIELVSER